MLTNLRIQNLAVIKDIDIDFYSGMSVLLGETGAGKSIIVEALSLLGGTRSAFSKMRDESKSAVIEGTFLLDENSDTYKKKVEMTDDDNVEMTISRILSPNKTSKVRIDGVSVSIAELKELADTMIDIHSQGENYKLFDSHYHALYLDLYDKSGKIAKCKGEYQKVYREYLDTKEELDDLYSSIKGHDREYLEFQISEIEKFKLKEDEIEELNDELNDINSYDDLKDSYEAFLEAYGDIEGGGYLFALSRLKHTLRSLENTPIGEHASKALDTCEDLSASLDDIVDAYEDLDFDPGRIDEINERLYSLKDLQRKYGKSTHEILEALNKYKEMLSNIDSFEIDKERLTKILVSYEQELIELGLKLTEVRKDSALKLEKAMDEELTDLGLKNGGFKVEIRTGDQTIDGFDRVEFLLALNVGSRFLPLKEAASGGENSRLMLAIKSLFNKLSPYDTIVFDEIDVGVSGPIAFKVGSKIKEISESSQTLVITHLPQVAAKGTHHYLVSKKVEGGETISEITLIEREKVAYEIAKMMSGSQVSENSIKAAEDLLKQ